MEKFVRFLLPQEKKFALCFYLCKRFFYFFHSNSRKRQMSKRLFFLLLVASILCGCLVVVRLYLNRQTLPLPLEGRGDWWPAGHQFVFLLWNLFLAWLPYLTALYIGSRVRSGRAWLTLVPALLFWLFFLPNAPYLITDLKHLRPRPPVPFWFDIVLLFSSAVTGLMLGVMAVHEVHKALQHRISAQKAHLFVAASIFLSGFGIWLGRFQRFNSWDLVTQPWRVFSQTLEALDSHWEVLQALAVSLSLAMVFGMAYLFLQAVVMEKAR